MRYVNTPLGFEGVSYNSVLQYANNDSLIETFENLLSGKPLDENVCNLVLQSQKTIALISQDYLNSDHCIEELEIGKTIKGGKRLVVVVLDVSVSVVRNFINKHFPEEAFSCGRILLQSHRYLQPIKYLDYDNGSPKFYKQLIKCLPEKE